MPDDITENSKLADVVSRPVESDSDLNLRWLFETEHGAFRGGSLPISRKCSTKIVLELVRRLLGNGWLKFGSLHLP